MFSVTPELYATVSLVSRWLFVFIALLLLFFALRRAKKQRRRGIFGEVICLI